MTTSAPAFDKAACLAVNPWGDGKGDDIYRVLSNKVVTARKAHECQQCLGPIEPGERHRAQREVSPDLGCRTFRFCPECCAAFAVSGRDCGDALVERWRLGERRARERSDAA